MTRRPSPNRAAGGPHLPPGPPPACATNPALFFPHPDDHQAIQQAKTVCAQCPDTYREPCLTYALDVNPHGIWCGTTPKERDQLRRHGTTAAQHLNDDSEGAA